MTYMLTWSLETQGQVGDTAGAIQHYEMAGTHCVEVPRMLFERDRVEDLEEYITQVAYGDRTRSPNWDITLCLTT